MKPLQTLLIATLTVIAAASASAAGNSVGVNFVNDGGRGVSSIDASQGELAPTESAGAQPQANWNNLARRGDTVTDGVTLTNSAGAATGLTIEWDAPGSFTNLPVVAMGSPDGKLMGSGISRGWDNTWPDLGPVGTNVYDSISGDKPLVYLGGLNAWMAAEGAEGYSILVYVSSAGSYWDTQTHWLQSVSGDPLAGTMVGGADLTPHKSIVNGFTFGGTYQEIKGTGDGMDWGQDWGANYCNFKGLTNDAVLIISRAADQQWGVAPLNGFQIVPQYPQPPIPSDPTFSPSSSVYANAPATVIEAATPDPVHTNLWYQWQSDNGSGGATFTDIPNATNATYTFTPTNSPTSYTLQFKVTVTNIFGSATSGASTLTVNPAVAPLVVVDTIPGAGGTPVVANVYTFVGGSVSFSNAYDGSRPITTKWQADTGTGYADIANSSSQSAQPAYVGSWVTVKNLQLTDSGNYRGYANNAYGFTNSTPTAVTVQAAPAAPDASQAYPYDVFTNGPVAYWRLNETVDPTVNYVQAYDYSGNTNNAIYGMAAYDNQTGPQSPQLPGFESANTGITVINNIAGSSVIAPPLNLNTNAVTITAWINPSSVVGPYWGLFTWANGSDKAGLIFGGQTNGNAVAELGYVWNTNSAATYNYHSGLYPPVGQWSFVTLTITPTNSTIYLYYVDQNTSKTNLFKAVQTINNSVEAFSGGTTWIGSDSGANHNFNGSIDEVAVFNKSLSEAQVQDLFLKAIGATCIIPNVADAIVYPAASVYSGQNVRLTATVSGTANPSMQWQSSPDGNVWTDVAGATTSSLLINPQMVGTEYYHLTAANGCGSGTNSAAAVTFNALPATPAGLWTVNYQITNNVLNGSRAGGVGHYVGRGILGNGTYWNVIPDTNGPWGGGSFTSDTSFHDDGTTPSGISCTVYAAGGVSSATAVQPDSSDIGNLLYQWVDCWYSPNELQFRGAPDGTYTLCVYSCDGSYANSGTTFTVWDSQNGNHTNSTVNAAPIVPLQEGVNFVLVTNVHIGGGTLNADITANSAVNNGARFNGAQLQLVSYDPVTPSFHASPTNIFVGQSTTFTDTSVGGTNWTWHFGDGNTVATATRGNVSHTYAATGTYTVIQTVEGPLGTASATNVNYILVSPRPAIGSATVSGGNLVLSGTDGIAGAQYRVLSSTNLTLPLGSWTPVLTNTFANDGSYGYTNSTSANNTFFILVSP